MSEDLNNLINQLSERFKTLSGVLHDIHARQIADGVFAESIARSLPDKELFRQELAENIKTFRSLASSKDQTQQSALARLERVLLLQQSDDESPTDTPT